MPALPDREERGGLILVVHYSADVDLSDFGHLTEAEHFLDVLVQSSRAHSVKILPNANFFLGNAIELLIVQAHVHFIVYVGPLRGVIDLVTEVSVSLHEVASLDEVIKQEFFLHCSVLSLRPTGAQTAQCRRSLNDLRRPHFFKMLSKHIYLLFNNY